MNIERGIPRRHDGAAEDAETVRAVFADALGLPEVTADDDFFDMGGDSLQAEKITIRLCELFDQDVRISMLFDYPTPRALAGMLAGAAPTPPAPPADARPPIFIVHGGGGYTVPKKTFFDALAPDQKLILFQLPGLNGKGRVPDTIPEMAAAYCDQIEQDQPRGRLHLAAFCDGGVIAVEMTRQLSQRGRKVDHMVLMDPGVPMQIHRMEERTPPDFLHRIYYLFVTGRFTGRLSPEDIGDKTVSVRLGRIQYVREVLRWLRSRVTGLHYQEFRPGKSVWAKSKIYAAKNTFIPPDYGGPVDIVCARRRLYIHNDPKGFWRRRLPRANVVCAMEDHHEVTGGETGESARVMQDLFDQAARRACLQG